jgi:hypothetical protein
MLCYRLKSGCDEVCSHTVAPLRKASVADDTTNPIYHPALLSKNATGLALRALARIATAAVGATAVVAVTTRIGHSIY